MIELLPPVQGTIMLRRIDPEHDTTRIYSLIIERDLFGTVRLVRHWSRIRAMQGRELPQDFATEEEPVEAIERLAAAKRRQGHQDL